MEARDQLPHTISSPRTDPSPADLGQLARRLEREVVAIVIGMLAGPHLVPPQEPATRPPLTVTAFGMHLHAVDGSDRKQLERVCRYLLRPPFAHDAVVALPDGRVRVLFKAP